MTRGGDDFTSFPPPPPNDLDPLYLATLCRILESHGCRALTLASWFGRGIELVSDARWLRFASGCTRECIIQLHHISRVYESLTTLPLEPIAHARLIERPRDQARGHDDFAVASVIFLRAWLEVLREHSQCSYLPYRETIDTLTHGTDARLVLAEQFLSEQSRVVSQDTLTSMVLHWLQRAETDLGPDNSPGVAYALSVGLKRRAPDDVRRSFRASLSHALDASGITVVLTPPTDNS